MSFCTTFVLATWQDDMLQCTDYTTYNVFIVHNILWYVLININIRFGYNVFHYNIKGKNLCGKIACSRDNVNTFWIK